MNFKQIFALLMAFICSISGHFALGEEPRLLIMDELSGDCGFGLIGLYGHGRVKPAAVCVSYGTASLDLATRNAQELLQLLGDSECPLYVGAAGPLTQPTWVKTLPRFYGTDGKVGVDYRTLSQAVPRPAPIQGQDRFFKLLDQSSTGSPNILCVLGPWTDIAKELREADKERRPSYLKNVSAVITVAGAFALDHDGKSIGNEGPERQAEYNVFLDPDALIEGVTYFNREKIPVYDISWSFQGRWRLWRPLLETLKPKNPDDGAAWAAILLASGFYTFHGGNTVTAGGGVGQRAWMTADAHALLFAETLCTRLQTGPLKENEKQVSHRNSAFKLTPTAFIVISNDKVPAQYGRTIRVEDLALAGFKDSTESRHLNVVEVNLNGSEQDALATFLRGMRLEIDETKWNDINRQLSTPHPASPTK